jgi:purine-binding chemotaxis protein CheW
MNIEPMHHRTAAHVTAEPAQYVTFRAGNSRYGIDVMTVQEIRSWQPTTPLPQRPSSARGVLDIRGQVVEVFDLGKLLGGPAFEPNAGSVVLVLSLDDKVMGVLVESVSDIIQVRPQDQMPVPRAAADGARSNQVSSMVNHEGQLVALMNVDALFPAANA